MDTALIITATPLLMWCVLAIVVHLLPPPATHLPETTDSPASQLDKMGATRARIERGRDGSWLKVETFKCPKSARTYKRTTRS